MARIELGTEVYMVRGLAAQLDKEGLIAAVKESGDGAHCGATAVVLTAGRG